MNYQEISSVYRSLALCGSENLRLQLITALMNLTPEECVALGVEYVLAAEVTATGPGHRAVVLNLLNQIFTLTNSIDHEWYEGDDFTDPDGLGYKIVPTLKSKRSTSVGDVIVSSGGAVYAVAPIGFQFIGQFRHLRF
jgi:hypothetical protein